MGLVNAVVAPAELVETAHKLAADIAAKAPKAVTAIKRSIHEGESMSQSAALALESRLFSELFGSHDQKEGTKAFYRKAQTGLHRPISQSDQPERCSRKNNFNRI